MTISAIAFACEKFEIYSPHDEFHALTPNNTLYGWVHFKESTTEFVKYKDDANVSCA
jgi:hypothetical protein